MWGRQGKDLDLTSPRAKTWKTVSVTDRPAVRSRTMEPVVAAADEAEVIARFAPRALLPIAGAVLALAFAMVFIGPNLPEEGPWGWWLGLAFIGFFVLPSSFGGVPTVISFLRHNRRAIYVRDGRLIALDPGRGLVSLKLGEIKDIRFDPAYRSGKTTVPVILFDRHKGRTRVIGTKPLDTRPGPVIERILALKAAQGGKE